MEPRIGAWCSICCHLDLYEIKDEETLQSVREDLADEDMAPHIMLWPTRRAALTDLRRNAHPLDRAEIDAMLAEDRHLCPESPLNAENGE
jgi:hypothetical protein